MFGGILLYFAYAGTSRSGPWLTLVALIFGQLTSYVRARAESLGFAADGGLAARADRLLVHPGRRRCWPASASRTCWRSR